MGAKSHFHFSNGVKFMITDEKIRIRDHSNVEIISFDDFKKVSIEENVDFRLIDGLLSVAAILFVASYLWAEDYFFEHFEMIQFSFFSIGLFIVIVRAMYYFFWSFTTKALHPILGNYYLIFILYNQNDNFFEVAIPYHEHKEVKILEQKLNSLKQ